MHIYVDILVDIALLGLVKISYTYLYGPVV